MNEMLKTFHWNDPCGTGYVTTFRHWVQPHRRFICSSLDTQNEWVRARWCTQYFGLDKQCCLLPFIPAWIINILSIKSLQHRKCRVFNVSKKTPMAAKSKNRSNNARIEDKFLRGYDVIEPEKNIMFGMGMEPRFSRCTAQRATTACEL